MAIGIILGIVFVVAAIASFAGLFYCSDRGNGTGAGILGVIGALLVIAFLIVPFSFHTVQSGQVAVVKHLGKVDDTERTAGTHFDFWITEQYVKYDTTVQTVDLTFSAYSADAQTMDVTMTLQYQIIAEKASDIATQYGALETLQNRITSIATEKAKSTLSIDKAMDIIANRAQMSPAVEDAIKTAIGESYYVNVAAVVLTDITFTDAFELAVEEKMIAEQAKLKAEYENQTKIAQAEAEAAAKLKAAEAEIEIAKAQAAAKLEATTANAKAVLIQAEADANALNIQTIQVAKMLGLTVLVEETDESGNVITTEKIKPGMSTEEASLIKAYIEYVKYLESWDGNLPDTVVGDGVEVILPTN